MRFRATFNNCTSIIDCLEICLEKPKNKNHNTVKYLISVTPQGVVSFISKGLEGQTSGKELTERSGYLDKLSVGDVILADVHFNIKESVGLDSTDLKIQAFTKGKLQLCPLELDEMTGLAAVQI